MTMRSLHISIFLLCVSVISAFAQGGEVSGRVTDEFGDGLPYADVLIVVDGVPSGQSAQTNMDGFYSIKPLTPGNYDVEAQYLGYANLMQRGVVVKNDQTTYIDFPMTAAEDVLEDVIIIDYKVPLIDPGETSSKQTVLAEDIKDLATRDIASIAATTAGVYQADEEGGINVRGGRGDAVVYYVDGIRITGSPNIPINSVEQIDIITGGVPARYGDATSGVINVTTKGARETFSGGIEARSSLDIWRDDLVNMNFSGPLIRNKATGKPVVGFFFAGEYRRRLDPNPSAIDMYKVKDDLFADLQNTPLFLDSLGNIQVRAETLTFDDLEVNRIKRNTTSNTATGSARFDFNLSQNMFLAVGGNFNYTLGRGWIEEYSLLNPENNPQTRTYNYKGFARFTHNLGKRNTGIEDEEQNNSIFQNAFYQVQFDYEKLNVLTEDDSHQDRYFDYGYIGEFQTAQAPSVAYQSDFIGPNGESWNLYVQNGFTDTAVTFNPSSVNERGANYTSQWFYYMDSMGTSVSDLNQVQSGLALINGERAEIPYSLWYNTGRQYNGYFTSEIDQFRGQITGSFDIVKRGSDTRNKHAISFGAEFQQQSTRSFTVSPLSLWDIARLQANSHIQSLDESNPYVLVDGERVYYQDGNFPDLYFQDTIYFDRLVDTDAQSVFDQRLRERIGAADNEFIDVFALPLETFSLDLFSPDELLNSGSPVVQWQGYDAYGNRFNEPWKFEDFWKKRDAEGNYLRPIGAYRPTYGAFFIEDKFQLKDLTFRLGLRIDRYDLNQAVLRDPLIVEGFQSVGDVNYLYNVSNYTNAADVPESERTYITHPGNISSDYVIYVDDALNPTTVTGYRNGDVWYNAEGVELADGNAIALQTGGTPQPFLTDTLGIKDPGFDPNSTFDDYDPEYVFMPRLQFSFNITDKALFFAHYDVLTQGPQARIGGTNSLIQRATGSPLNYYFLEEFGGSPIANPAIRPETTVDFQVGFKQKLTNSSAFTISAYFKEFRNQVQIKQLNNAYPQTYFSYANIDFGNTKGFDFVYDLRRTRNFKASASYTLQFAEGSGSDDQTQLQVVANTGINFRTVSPLDYDARHLMNLVLDYRFADGRNYNGPVSKRGKQILSNAGLNIRVNANSGTPYTQIENPIATRQIGGQRVTTAGYINGSRIGWNFRVDLKLDKSFTIKFKQKDDAEGPAKSMYFNAYVMAQNVLGTLNVRNVYRYTGSATEDGWLQSPEAQTVINSSVSPDSYRDLYSASVNRPGNFTLPRRIFLGLSMNF